MAFLRKTIKGITIVGTLVILLIFIALGAFTFFEYTVFGLKYGENTRLNNINKASVLYVFQGPKEINEIRLSGYTSPKRELRKNETLLIIKDGPIILLYFNTAGKLIFKQVLSS